MHHEQQNVSMLIVLRLLEMSPKSMSSVIQSYKQLCDIEEQHMVRMLSLQAQQKTETKPTDQHGAWFVLGGFYSNFIGPLLPSNQNRPPNDNARQDADYH